MKKISIILVIMFSVANMCANDTIHRDATITELSTDVRLIINEMPNVVVHQDSLITNLMMDKNLGIQRGVQEVDGFRVQIYASNQPQAAKNEALYLQQDLISHVDVDIYIISEPPFWKVRLGDFKTRHDANEYKDWFNDSFPELRGSTYVVPDKVTIKY